MDTDNEITQTPLYQRIWFTPLIGLMMFALGLSAGYFGRPLLSPEPESTELASVPNPPGADAGQSGNQEVMAFLIKETRHYLGDSNAPVTIIEFSDFK